MGFATESAAETEALTLLLLGAGEIRDALSEALEAAGQDVEHGDLAHALASVTAAAPDLVVLIAEADDSRVRELLDALAGDRNGSVSPVVVIGATELSNVAPNYRQGAVATLSAKLPVAKLAQRLVDIGNGVPERSGTSEGAVPNGQVGALLGGISGQKRTGKLTVSDGAGRQSRSLMLKGGESITEPAQDFVSKAGALVEPAGGRFKFEERTTARIDSVVPPPPAAAAAAAPPRPVAAAVRPPPAAVAAKPAVAQPVATQRVPEGGPRVLVVDSQPTRAAALAAALAQRGAEVRTLGARPTEMEALLDFDPQVVLVTAKELSSACEASVAAIESHPRLRWASLLVAPDGLVGSGQLGGPSIDALFGKLDKLVQPDRELATGAAGRSEFATRLELIGPVRTLRAIAAAGVNSRVLIRHPRVSVELAFGADGAVRARARARERGNEPMDGAPAIATLFAIQSGRVQVRRAVTAPTGAESLESLLRAALALGAPIRSSLAPPDADATPVAEPVAEAAAAAPSRELPPPPPSTLRIQDLISAALQPASSDTTTPADDVEPASALSSGVQPVARLTPADAPARAPERPDPGTGTPPAPEESVDDAFDEVAISVQPAAPAPTPTAQVDAEVEQFGTPPALLSLAGPTPSASVVGTGRVRSWIAVAVAVLLLGGAIAWLGGGGAQESVAPVAAATGAAPAVAAAPAPAATAGSAPASAPSAPGAARPATPGPSAGAAAPVAPVALAEADPAPAPEPAPAVVDAEEAGEEAGEDEPIAASSPHARELREAAKHVADATRYRRQGRLGLAEAAYLRALAAFPRYPRAIAGVVRVHLDRKDGREAVRWAEQLVKMQPNRSNNQLLLGDAYALRGQRSAAVTAWKLSAKYGNRVARQRLGEVP